MNDLKRISYIVCGHINLHKSQPCGADLISYLCDLSTHFKLNGDGHIIGMDKYGYNAREARKNYGLAGDDYNDYSHRDIWWKFAFLFLQEVLLSKY